MSDNPITDDILYDDAGFTFHYQNYAAPLTEAPERYHSFASLAIISTLLGRRVWLPHGARDIYPNVWVALVGKSSQLKKSTALHIASDLITQHNHVLLYPEDFSREALFEAISERSSGLFVWNELGGVLKALDASYMVGTKEFLTELYDCPSLKTRKLKSKGEVIIRDACPVVLCASTVDWLIGNLNKTDLMSGFAARFVYVPADEASKILPVPPRKDLMVRDYLIAEMGEIAKIEGEMNFTPESLSAYEDWYRKFHRKIKSLNGTSRAHAFASRLQTYALKFAMLYQIARDRSMHIDEDAIWRATMVCDWLFGEAVKLVDEQLAITQREQDSNDLAEFIRSEGIVKRTKLLRTFRKHKAQDLRDILQNLIDSEQVKEQRIEKSTAYAWRG